MSAVSLTGCTVIAGAGEPEAGQLMLGWPGTIAWARVVMLNMASQTKTTRLDQRARELNFPNFSICITTLS
jgi:hypothetical protein